MTHLRRCISLGAALAASLPLLTAPAAAQCGSLTLPGATGDGLGERIAAVGDVDADGIGDLLVYAKSFGLGTGYVEVRSGRNSAVLHRIDYNSYLTVALGLGSAGDLDGDGHDDVIIGEPGYSTPFPGTGPNGAGRVRVFSGADFSVLLEVGGQESFGYFGYAVDSLADVDQDGVRDLVVGEPGNNQNGGLNGAAHLISGATGTVLHSVYGEVRDRLGATLDVIGDLDHDGFEDVAVGAPYEDRTYVDQGAAYVYSGADFSILRQITGYAEADAMGSAVTAVGDWNGDGTVDWAVSAPQAFGAGAVVVLSGASGTNLAWLTGGTYTTGFGQVLGSGDLDGDGQAELIVGTPWAPAAGPASGSVQVFGTFGLLQNAWSGDAAYDQFGSSFAVPGDLDGDGLNDLVVGAPGADANGQNSGKLVAFLCGGLQLQPVAPGIAGQSNVLRATGATAGNAVAFHASLQLGSTPLLGCPGESLQLKNPVLAGIATADAQGSAQLTLYVPPAAHGRAVAVQAAEPALCRVSAPRLELIY